METIAVFIGSLLVLLVVGFLVNIFTGGWQVRRVVVRGFRIGFEPISDDEPIHGYYLSSIVRDLLAGDPKFVAIIGRPAGPINFLREFLGFPRRAEFVISKQQAVLRAGSFTSQSIILSKMHGLNSIGIARGKPNPIGVIFTWIAINYIMIGIYESTRHYSMSYSDPTVGYVMLAVITLIPCLIYYFLNKVVSIVLYDGTDKVQRITIHPPFWERLFGKGGLLMTLDDANRVAQVFRVLKDS